MAKAAIFEGILQALNFSDPIVTFQCRVMFVDPSIDGGWTTDEFTSAIVDLSSSVETRQAAIRNAIKARGLVITNTIWTDEEIYQPSI